MITLTQFWSDVAVMAHGHMGQRLRYGQIAFNMLLDTRPDLAAQVRGTDADPFYAGGIEDERFINFTLFLKENW